MVLVHLPKPPYLPQAKSSVATKQTERSIKHKWKLEEIKQLLGSAECLRDKAIILCLFQSGLAVGDLVSLRYGDVRRQLEDGTLPLLLHIYRQKTGVEFKTFMGRDAVHYLKMYLKTRDPLRDEEPLFTKLGSEEKVTEGAVQDRFRKYAEKAELIDESELEGWNPVRSHSLRAAFESRLMGKMDRVLLDFFMGHEIGEERRAYLTKPEDELRELYAQFEHLLAVEKTSRKELIDQGPPPLPDDVVNRIEGLETTIETLTNQNVELQSQIEKLEIIKRTAEDALSRLERTQTEQQREMKDKLKRYDVLFAAMQREIEALKRRRKIEVAQLQKDLKNG